MIFVSGEEAKTMWLKLRNSYRDARRRQMKCIKSGAAPENIRLWRFQKQMTFLERFMSSGHREGNVNDSDDDSQLPSALPISNEILDSENVDGDNSHESVTHEQFNNADVDRDNIEESTRKTSGTLVQTPVASSKQSKKRKQDDMQSLLKRALQQRDERTKKREEERRKLESRDNLTDDPLYNFFISMYQLTRKMPPNYQHRVRTQLFQAVSKAEEEIMNIPSRPPSTLTSSHYSVVSSPYPSSHDWSDSQSQTLIHCSQQQEDGNLQDQPGISGLADYVSRFGGH